MRSKLTDRLIAVWIKDIELYNLYTSKYTAYIKSRLLSESASNRPEWRYIYTAVTLNIANSADFSTVCKLFIPGSLLDHDRATAIQSHLFGELKFYIESLDIDDYLSRLKKILVDPSQSGDFHVNMTRYYELATELFDMFTLQEKSQKV